MNVAQALQAAIARHVSEAPTAFLVDGQALPFYCVAEPDVENLDVDMEGMRERRQKTIHVPLTSEYSPRNGQLLTIGDSQWKVAQYNTGPAVRQVTLVSVNE
jgi:hypothetical protein